MQYDFRSIYASILERWFCVSTDSVSEVMLQPFQSLPIIESAPCGFITANQPESEKKILFKAYPNPVVDFVKLDFFSDGGMNVIQVFNASGRMVANPLSENKPYGLHTEIFNAGSFPTGVYYARWQNNTEQKIIRIIKS